MKIFTITCHDVYNYGASLQAYALQKYLLDLGNECFVIDYKPEYLNRTYNFWYIEKNSRFYSMCQRSKFIHFLYSLRLVPLTFKTWRRKIPFDRFKNEYLLCTRRYNTLRELQLDPPLGDVYIAGSDQIWNCNLPNGKDNAFFLDFGHKETIRIAYAASLGIPSFPTSEISRIAKLLSSFDSISVRESSAKTVIEGLGLNCYNVCDPVFLLNRGQWQEIIPSKTPKEKYILVYDIFADDNSMRQAAINKSIETGLPSYSINDSHKCSYAHNNISDAGPLEFLWYINNAELVISNSFHATALSVLFNRDFATFYTKPNASRMKDFLEFVNLSNLFNPKSLTPVETWNFVHAKLEEFVSFSRSFLRKSLE